MAYHFSTHKVSFYIDSTAKHVKCPFYRLRICVTFISVSYCEFDIIVYFMTRGLWEMWKQFIPTEAGKCNFCAGTVYLFMAWGEGRPFVKFNQFVLWGKLLLNNCVVGLRLNLYILANIFQKTQKWLAIKKALLKVAVYISCHIS